MKTIRSGIGLGIVVLLILCTMAGRAQDPTGPGKIDVKVIKYDGLAQAVLKHKGKVVVVDAWGIYCAPCLKGIPHLVEMNNKYADKGLVAITLHVDPPFDAETKNLAVKALNKYKVTTINFMLDEPSQVWQEKLHSNFIPTVFVFNREGKWTQFSTEGVKYDEIEKLVVKLLDQK